jgi:hypothetical protein
MQTMAYGSAGICVSPAWKELIATVTDECVSDAVVVLVFLATCSLTELMVVASTHSATAVPRIQRINP